MQLDPVSKELVLSCRCKILSLQHNSYFVVISYYGKYMSLMCLYYKPESKNASCLLCVLSLMICLGPADCRISKKHT